VNLEILYYIWEGKARKLVFSFWFLVFGFWLKNKIQDYSIEQFAD